jgi:hypothetical protein
MRGCSGVHLSHLGCSAGGKKVLPPVDGDEHGGGAHLAVDDEGGAPEARELGAAPPGVITPGQSGRPS